MRRQAAQAQAVEQPPEPDFGMRGIVGRTSEEILAEPDEEEQALTVLGPTALSAVTSAEVDIQIATAQRFPRSVTRALDDAISLATLTPEIAEDCFYSLPRAGKAIMGPSARLAEIMADSWGHMRVQARIVDETRTHIVAEGAAWDLQKNVAWLTQVKQRITNRDGSRYNDDMLTVAASAALSKASRNAVFKAIPASLTDIVYKKAIACAAGNTEPLAVRREKALSWFKKLGITQEQVFELLGVSGTGDMTAEDVARLQGLATAVRNNEATIDDIFPQAPKNKQQTQANQRAADAEPAAKPKADPATGEVKTEEGVTPATNDEAPSLLQP